VQLETRQWQGPAGNSLLTNLLWPPTITSWQRAKIEFDHCRAWRPAGSCTEEYGVTAAGQASYGTGQWQARRRSSSMGRQARKRSAVKDGRAGTRRPGAFKIWHTRAGTVDPDEQRRSSIKGWQARKRNAVKDCWAGMQRAFKGRHTRAGSVNLDEYRAGSLQQLRTLPGTWQKYARTAGCTGRDTTRTGQCNDGSLTNIQSPCESHAAVTVTGQGSTGQEEQSSQRLTRRNATIIQGPTSSQGLTSRDSITIQGLLSRAETSSQGTTGSPILV